MYLAVKDVIPQDDYLLLLTFEIGETPTYRSSPSSTKKGMGVPDDQLKSITFSEEKRQFDVKPFLHLGIFQELKDERLFRSVRKSFDTIEWANEADFDPEFLYQMSRKVD